MKLAACVLLSLAVLASADTSYQNYQTYQNQRSSEPAYYQEPSGGNNYYQSSALAQPRQSFTGYLRSFLPSNINRQGGGIGAIFGGLGPIIIIVIVVGVGIAAIAAAVAASQLNSSGRGLDTDDWEVDHSVWMNQLQKDFEDSWSAE